MISEKQFANGFPSFWAECTPFLTPHLIAEMNLNARILPDNEGRALKPVLKEDEGESSTLITEVAFEIFVKAVSAKTDVLTFAKNDKLLEDIESNSIARLLGLHLFWRSIGERFPKTPMHKSINLAVRLERFFTEEIKAGSLITQPRLRGCGLLNSSYGDILTGETLYEVKMVDRNLRSTDLRQVLIYCALNYYSQQYDIQAVSIINPRRGVEYAFRLDKLTERIANKTPPELFHMMTEFLLNFESTHIQQ